MTSGDAITPMTVLEGDIDEEVLDASVNFHQVAQDRTLEGDVVDGDLQQFVADLSSHVLHIQNLIKGLEQRIEGSGHRAATLKSPAESKLRIAACRGAFESPPEKSKSQKSILKRQTVDTRASIQPVVRNTLPGSVTSDDDFQSRQTMLTEIQSRQTMLTEIPKDWASHNTYDPDRPPAIKRNAQFDVEDEMRQLKATKTLRRSMLNTRKSMAARLSMVSIDSKFSVHKSIHSMMTSRQAELTISFLIFINAIVIGAQVDDQMKNPTENGDTSTFRAIDTVFTILFSIELLFRWVAESITGYFSRKNPKLYWNLFDFVLIVLSITEEFLNAALGSIPNVSLLRLFRIFRLVRIFRIVRVMRFFRDLRIMASGIVQSMQSLVWALGLLFTIMYLTVVCLMQFAVEEGQKRVKDDGAGDLTDAQYSLLLEHFGSFFKALYTLYSSILGGIDWQDAAEPLFDMGWVFGVFYCAYISFAILCVMNIITGVFVENCNKMTAKDEDLVYMEELEQRRQWYDEVHEIFRAVDIKRSGFLNAREFSDKVEKDVRLRAWLRKIGVHIESYSANGLFQLLDLDGDGALDFNEFALALQQLHGHARSIDVAKIAHSMSLLRRMILGIAERLTPDLIESDELIHRAMESIDVRHARHSTSTSVHSIESIDVPPPTSPPPPLARRLSDASCN